MQKIFGAIPGCVKEIVYIVQGARDCSTQRYHRNCTIKSQLRWHYTKYRKLKSNFMDKSSTRKGSCEPKKKVRAIKECARPHSQTEVGSFLGMTGYL